MVKCEKDRPARKLHVSEIRDVCHFKSNNTAETTKHIHNIKIMVFQKSKPNWETDELYQQQQKN